MDAGNPIPDAEDYPVQILQGADLGGSGHVDGEKMYQGERKKGI